MTASAMFASIHPFGDGNGRISRRLTLLLYQAGHEVGRYISLERIPRGHQTRVLRGARAKQPRMA